MPHPSTSNALGLLQEASVYRGSATVLELTNFSDSEFHDIWMSAEKFINSNYNVGRGCKSKHSGKFVLLMKFFVLKDGGNWYILATMFCLKGPSFELMIMRFINIISPQFYNVHVVDTSNKRIFPELLKYNKAFRTHNTAIYATDVTV